MVLRQELLQLRAFHSILWYPMLKHLMAHHSGCCMKKAQVVHQCWQHSNEGGLCPLSVLFF
nr:MAG TPA: hypothetical protein [Crassvirales sp.]